MLDQMQVVNNIPLLSTLLEHPDFQEGVREGKRVYSEGFFDEDHERAWTEDDIITFMDWELGAKRYRRGVQLEQAIGCPPVSYLHHLGFTLSYLDQALFAKAQED